MGKGRESGKSHHNEEENAGNPLKRVEQKSRLSLWSPFVDGFYCL